MLLPLSSHWSPEPSELDGESQFNGASDIAFSYYRSAAVRPMLAPTRPKPADENDSLSPPQILSDSTFSLLSRKYSPSTTESSCECSETSSVDENFLCGSGSPTMGPTNWEESSEHSNEDLSAGNLDADEKSFSLSDSTPDVLTIMPLAGMPEKEQSSPSHSSHGITSDADLTAGETVSEVAGRESAEVRDSNRDLAPIERQEDEADISLILAIPTTTDVSLRPPTTNSNNKIPASSSFIDSESDSLPSPETAVTVSCPRQSSLSSSIHTCSTCHLYAPSTSVTFYLDAWLNQQNDIHPSSISENKVKSKKRVNWPDTTAELRNIIVVDKWIEKGLHVHPQPLPRSQRLGDSDDDDDDVPEFQQSKACDKEEVRVTVHPREGKQEITEFPQSQAQEAQVQPTPPSPQTHTSTAGSSTDSDCESVGSSATSLRLKDAAAVLPRKPEVANLALRSNQVNKALVQLQRKTETPSAKRPSPPSSVSSASSSSTSSSSKPQQQRVIKHNKPMDITVNQNSIPRVVTQLPAPKKKYSSGVTVKIIGGPYSEHEAAMQIRGVDPIKHRAMIENYWQF